MADRTAAGDTNSVGPYMINFRLKLAEMVCGHTWIRIHSSTAECSLEDTNWCKDKPWAYLDQARLRWAVGLQRVFFDDLMET